MSHFWAEVVLGDIKNDNTEHKLKIVGLHDTTSKTKPEPRWGGATCVPIGEMTYKCLSASHGSIEALKMMVKTLDENFQGDD